MSEAIWIWLGLGVSAWVMTWVFSANNTRKDIAVGLLLFPFFSVFGAFSLMIVLWYILTE